MSHRRTINAIEPSEEEKLEEKEESLNDDNSLLRVNMVKTLIDGLSDNAKEELFDCLEEEADGKDFQ